MQCVGQEQFSQALLLMGQSDGQLGQARHWQGEVGNAQSLIRWDVVFSYPRHGQAIEPVDLPADGGDIGAADIGARVLACEPPQILVESIDAAGERFSIMLRA